MFPLQFPLIKHQLSKYELFTELLFMYFFWNISDYNNITGFAKVLGDVANTDCYEHLITYCYATTNNILNTVLSMN